MEGQEEQALIMTTEDTVVVAPVGLPEAMAAVAVVILAEELTEILHIRVVVAAGPIILVPTHPILPGFKPGMDKWSLRGNPEFRFLTSEF
jgi:hypothetical protein